MVSYFVTFEYTRLTLHFRLRIHDTQEWYDLYQPRVNDELQRFFDRYTKGIENGWETTPRVRVSLLGFNEARRTVLYSRKSTPD